MLVNFINFSGVLNNLSKYVSCLSNNNKNGFGKEFFVAILQCCNMYLLKMRVGVLLR